MRAIGLIETKGLIGLIGLMAATDAMMKAANVQIVKRIGIGGGLITIIVSGDVGSYLPRMTRSPWSFWTSLRLCAAAVRTSS